MKKEKLEGRIFNSKSYGDFEVISYENNKYNIKFLKTGTILKTTKNHIINGSLRDSFYPIICGVGYMGDTKSEKRSFLYNRWRAMIYRCYNKKDSRYSTCGAKGILVCNRWHNFSNFIEDVVLLEGYDENLVKNAKLNLDKDIIDRDAKIYSPETCKWVTASENTKEMLKRTRQKEFIAFRLIDDYEETSDNMKEFCEKMKLTSVRGIMRCLSGKTFQFEGWRFRYKNESFKFIHKQPNKINTSGYVGIHLDKNRNEWYVDISSNKKRIFLGRYKDLKDAIIARYEWEVKNYGINRKIDSKDIYLKEIEYIK